jgi:hypothetical protein
MQEPMSPRRSVMAWEVAAAAHPVPQLVEVVVVAFELGNAGRDVRIAKLLPAGPKPATYPIQHLELLLPSPP